ncbi:MAG: WYL domain-containing protein [Leucobacter sp.]|nr:WYL domain-containing protein [Leucobacter sp.]
MTILSEVREAHAGAGSGAAEPVPSEAADRGPGPASAPRDARLNAPERVVLLLSLVPYLREHGETPLAKLAATFEVEPETLRDLIEFLGTAGVPGETGTYQDEDLFDIDWDALEREDLVRLTRVVAVDDAPRFAAGERAALIAGLHSLFPLLPEAERAHARSAAEKLGAAAAGEPAESPISITADPADAGVRRAAEAIETRHRLRFSYRDLRGSESDRTVEPVALTQYGSAWYLRAFCLDRLSERTFLVDAMRDVEVLDEPVRALASGAAGGFRGLGPDDVEIEATAVVHAAAFPRIQAFAPHAVAEVDGERRRVIVRLSHPSAAVRLVQAAPGDVTLEGPESARRAIHAWADAALGEYDA